MPTKVSTIALDSVGDLSYFNRAFADAMARHPRNCAPQQGRELTDSESRLAAHCEGERSAGRRVRRAAR